MRYYLLSPLVAQFPHLVVHCKPALVRVIHRVQEVVQVVLHFVKVKHCSKDVSKVPEPFYTISLAIVTSDKTEFESALKTT